MKTNGLINARTFEGLARGVNLRSKMLGAARLVLVRGMSYTEAGAAVGASRQAVKQACDRLLQHAGKCTMCGQAWPDAAERMESEELRGVREAIEMHDAEQTPAAIALSEIENRQDET